MFEEVEREYSFVSWLSQLALGYIGPILALGVVENLLNVGDRPGLQVFEYCFLGVASFICALFLSAVARQTAKERVLDLGSPSVH